MLVNLPPTLIMNYIFLGQKSSIDFSPHFSPFYPDRVTSESYNNPLKVIPEGSMVEYLPVGSKEGPQTIIGKKISRPKFLNHNPSPLCTGIQVKPYFLSKRLVCKPKSTLSWRQTRAKLFADTHMMRLWFCGYSIILSIQYFGLR